MGVAFFKKCSRNFDPSKNMATVGGGGDFEHYMDMRNFLKILLRNRLSEFGIILQDCSLGDPFQNCSQNFDPLKNMAAGGGAERDTDMKKFLKIFFTEIPSPIWK